MIVHETKQVLKSLLRYSEEIVICISSNFSVIEINNRAEKFYNLPLQQVRDKNFLTLCQLFEYTVPIKKTYFDNPAVLNINLDTKNSSGQQYNIDWVVCPLIMADKKVEGAILIGKNIQIKEDNANSPWGEFLNSIPGYLYWKDFHGNYLGCNSLTAELAGLDSVQDVVGMTDQDLWGKQANQLINNDKKVIDTGVPLIVHEQLQTETESWMHFTGLKMPLRDEKGKIIGVIGNSLDMTKYKVGSNNSNVIVKNVLRQFQDRRYYLLGKYQGTYLTQREAQYMFCLSLGHSNKEIAQSLKISVRTTEEFAKNIKRKFGCSSKSQLIARAIEGRFLEGVKPNFYL